MGPSLIGVNFGPMKFFSSSIILLEWNFGLGQFNWGEGGGEQEGGGLFGYVL